VCGATAASPGHVDCGVVGFPPLNLIRVSLVTSWPEKPKEGDRKSKKESSISIDIFTEAFWWFSVFNFASEIKFTIICFGRFGAEKLHGRKVRRYYYFTI